MSYSWGEWVNKRIEIASCLHEGGCGGSYFEAIIILSAAISSLAAEMWPGERIDGKRFVEAVKNCQDVTPEPTRISIPLLIGNLYDNKRTEEAELLCGQFMDFQETLVLTGDRVDRTEAEIMKICPRVSPQIIRRRSYAHLLYGELRSPLAHEYCVGEKAHFLSHNSAREAAISYFNFADDRDRHIYFNIRWVSDIARSLAREVVSLGDKIPLARPDHWWIDQT